MHGGKRAGSGRKAGIPNKATAEVKELARQHGPEAVGELARLALKSKSDTARVAAIRELLDRAYGKSAPSPEEREDTKALVVQLVKYRA